LGLTIAYKLTELHGGSLHVESTIGKGSRFIVSLPWEEPTHPITASPIKKNAEVSQEPRHSLKPSVKILLADDHEINTMMLGEYLESRGYEVIIARDGLEALAKAEDILPHLIIMDIQMPEMDGLEAIQHLRADPRFISTPVIALTALAMSGDRERCLEAGANEYMSKPVSLKTLAEKIQEILRQEK
jgi:CheY-like chemotaxis protein